MPVPAATTSNKKISKKAKREKDFSSQTTRFRVQTDNTGVPDVLPSVNLMSRLEPSTNERATIPFATFQSPPPSSVFVGYTDPYSTSSSQLGVSQVPSIASSSHNTKTRWKTRTIPSDLGRMPDDSSSSARVQPRKISPHYRRDYEKGKQVEASEQPNTKKSKSLVTLLIEDNRTGAPDSQLAEVRLALRKASELDEGGYWGKTEELVGGCSCIMLLHIFIFGKCKQLQSSPSRIDGKFNSVSRGILYKPSQDLRKCILRGVIFGNSFFVYQKAMWIHLETRIFVCEKTWS